MRKHTLNNIVKWGFLQDIFGFCFLRRTIIPRTAILVYLCPLCGKEFSDVDNRTFFEFQEKCLKHLDKCYWHSKKPVTMDYIFTKKKIARMRISYN